MAPSKAEIAAARKAMKDSIDAAAHTEDPWTVDVATNKVAGRFHGGYQDPPVN